MITSALVPFTSYVRVRQPSHTVLLRSLAHVARDRRRRTRSSLRPYMLRSHGHSSMRSCVRSLSAAVRSPDRVARTRLLHEYHVMPCNFMREHEGAVGLSRTPVSDASLHRFSFGLRTAHRAHRIGYTTPRTEKRELEVLEVPRAAVLSRRSTVHRPHDRQFAFLAAHL